MTIGSVFETSRHQTATDMSRGRGPATALRATSVLAVLAILWQGATAGELLMRDRAFLELHQIGAIAVHVLTGLVAVAAFLLWRETRGPRWPLVVSVLVFAASFVQAALGDDATMWAHVPGALVLMLGAGAVLVWAFVSRPYDRA
jgi:hypothetical protein